MIFESLPRTPTAEELTDKAFSRAARAGRAKGGVEGQVSMVQTAGNILADNLTNIAEQWPDFDEMHPFYAELAGTIVDVPALRSHLGDVTWAGRKCAELRDDYRRRIARTDPATGRKHRKQAFARMADVVGSVDEDLRMIGDARDRLRRLPDIRAEVPTIVVAGYPNVGKSSFVKAVTRADPRIASYPFTTTGIGVGHLERDHVTYQIVDTPGLLDRPLAERNAIERQALSAVTHAADCVLVLIDASEACGYPIGDQLALRDEINETFDPTPVLTVCNKMDRSRDVPADHYMSVTEDEGVGDVVDAAVESIGFVAELPFEG